jgi:ABC-type branched-subunit amino acid transport system permease subunit
VLIVYIPIWLAEVANSPTSNFASNLPQIVFGLLIVGVVLVAPTGLQGSLQKGASALRRRIGASRNTGERARG